MFFNFNKKGQQFLEYLGFYAIVTVVLIGFATTQDSPFKGAIDRSIDRSLDVIDTRPIDTYSWLEGGVTCPGCGASVTTCGTFQCLKNDVEVVDDAFCGDIPTTICGVACIASGPTSTCCGNGEIDVGEVCDIFGPNLDGQTCASQIPGFSMYTGTIGCAPGCAAFILAGCLFCGDGAVGPGEDCDPGFGINPSCVDELGGGPYYLGSVVVCNTNSCTVDTSECIWCGDDLIQAPEQCDGGIGFDTCIDAGPEFHQGGTLECDLATCTYDTSGCPRCGDGIINGNSNPASPDYEECDGDPELSCAEASLNDRCAPDVCDSGSRVCTSCAFVYDCSYVGGDCSALPLGSAQWCNLPWTLADLPSGTTTPTWVDNGGCDSGSGGAKCQIECHANLIATGTGCDCPGDTIEVGGVGVCQCPPSTVLESSLCAGGECDEDGCAVGECYNQL